MFAEKKGSFFGRIGKAFRFDRERDNAREGRQGKQEVEKDKQVALEVERIIGSTNERDSIEQVGKTIRDISSYLREVSDNSLEDYAFAGNPDLLAFELKIPSGNLSFKFAVKVRGDETRLYNLWCDQKTYYTFERDLN